MKTLKIIGIILLVILGLIFIPPVFLNGEYAVEKEVIIDQPSGKLFTYLKYLKNQEEYSVWSKMDPNMKKTYTGTDGTVGAIYRWEGDKKTVGTGEQEITAIDEGNRIDFELRFEIPFESTDYAYLETIPVNDSVTTVKWGFTGAMKGPAKWFLVMMDMESTLGDQLQEGLDNVKEIQKGV
jgi:hypothetical protein